MKLQEKTTLVTGAASGIGRATALAFGRAGSNLVLCDVDEVGLRAAETECRALGRTVFGRRVDVADREGMRAFAEEVGREVGVVDVLVNNAGVAVSGGLLDTPLEDWDWQLSINVFGVVHGCHFFVPPMVARGKGGHVVNVSSTAGFFGTEALVAYCTSKFAVLGMSESLRDELARHDIGVTTICPGVINTPIAAHGRMRGKFAAPGVQDKIKEGFQRRNYGPEKVGAAIVDAVLKGKTVVPVSPEAWFTYYLKRASPNLTAKLGKSIFSRTMRRVGL